jgi:hypothetical protein
MAEGEGAAQVFKEITIEFGDFAKLFDNYATQLKDTETVWRNIAGLWKTMPPGSSSGDRGSGGEEHSPAADLAKRYQTDSLKYFKNFGGYSKSFDLFRGEISAMTGLLGRIGEFGKILGARSVIGTVAATAGFAINQATSFRDKQAQGAAYGLNPYQQAAFGNVFKDYIGEGGAASLFGGLVQQETTLGGPQMLRNWLQRYGVKQTGKETQEEQAENILRAERTMATTTDPSRWQAWIDAYKIGNVADINTMMRFRTKGTTAEELEGRIKEERKAGKDYLSDEDAKKLTDLARDWGKTIQDIGKGLDALGAKLSPWFGGIIKQWDKELEEFLGTGFHKTPEEMKGYKWKLEIPDLSPWWDKMKGLFTNPFGSPAKAGELAPGVTPTGGVPVQDKLLLDYLKQNSGTAAALTAAADISTAALLGGGGRGPGRSPSGQRGGAAYSSAESIGPIDLGDPEAKVGSYSDAMRVLMKAGLTRNEAAGMAGNATAESLLGTMMHGKVLGAGTGDSGKASGMFQWWPDRWAKELAWARSQGLDPTKPSTQLKMGAHEYITQWRAKLGARINAATTPADIERAINPYEGNASGPGRPSAVGGVSRALKEGATGPTSMNDLNNYQGAHPAHFVRLNVNNQAGANVIVQGGMLGAGSGNYQVS